MDLGTLNSSLPPTPAEITAQVVVLRGAFVPIVLPLAGLPPDLRLSLVESHPGLGMEARIAAAFAAGKPELAWQHLATEPQPLSAVGHVDDLLLHWSADESVRLGLPEQRTGVEVVGTAATPPEARAEPIADGALALVQDILAPWPWPRWYGPVVVVVDAGDANASATSAAPETTALATPPTPWSPLRPDGTFASGGPPLLATPALLASFPALSSGQSTLVARAALPLVRVSAHDDLRAACAGAFADLALRLGAPPPQGWPPWFTRGVIDLALAKGHDQFVSPRHSQELRTAAGPAGLAAFFTDPHPDPALCVAVVSFLLHPARRNALPSFCALLRQGASSVGALRVAYGLELTDLINQR